MFLPGTRARQPPQNRKNCGVTRPLDFRRRISCRIRDEWSSFPKPDPGRGGRLTAGLTFKGTQSEDTVAISLRRDVARPSDLAAPFRYVGGK